MVSPGDWANFLLFAGVSRPLSNPDSYTIPSDTIDNYETVISANY